MEEKTARTLMTVIAIVMFTLAGAGIAYSIYQGIKNPDEPRELQEHDRTGLWNYRNESEKN